MHIYYKSHNLLLKWKRNFTALRERTCRVRERTCRVREGAGSVNIIALHISKAHNHSGYVALDNIPVSSDLPALLQGFCQDA